MKCFNCSKPGKDIHGISICESCLVELRLFNDETIARQREEYMGERGSYEKEIDYRLDFIEKDFLKKKLKLLHIKERLGLI
jgi:hypothetical protein